MYSTKKTINGGYYVNFVFAHEVACIEAESELDINVRFHINMTQNKRITVRFPQPDFFSTDNSKNKFNCTLKFSQFPIHVNNATTGHKLQGSSLDSLMISSWSYTQNWPYVMLSRIRTLNGLYLHQPLKYQGGKQGKDYTAPPELLHMQEFFKDTKSPDAFQSNFDENEIYNDSFYARH